jgi:hypothetical protein
MTEDGLRDLAARYAWWRAPEAALADRRRFIAQVMELGTWDDAHALMAAWGADAFRAVLRDPPPGVLSPKAWRFWHLRLLGAPPSSARAPGRVIPATAGA